MTHPSHASDHELTRVRVRGTFRRKPDKNNVTSTEEVSETVIRRHLPLRTKNTVSVQPRSHLVRDFLPVQLWKQIFQAMVRWW